MIYLSFPKRHSDPAPYSNNSDIFLKQTQSPKKSVKSAPDLRREGSSPSPRRSPIPPKKTPTSSPSKQDSSRRTGAIKYRRLSSTSSYGGSSTDTVATGYYNTTPRRATHPSASPRRYRRSSLWLESETDPWSEFRNKYLKSVSPNRNRQAAGSIADSSDTPEGCYRLRSFSVTSRGVVNLGDFLKARSYSDASVPPDMIDDDVIEPEEEPRNKYRVLLLGDEGVGKTSILAQFMTSESLTSMTDPQSSIDGTEERTVCLLVDDEESELVCEDPTYFSYEVNESVYSSIDAFIVVYAVTDEKSFQYAEKVLRTLRKMKSKSNFLRSVMPTKTVILVANKIDLARCRIICTEEGRCLADRYNVKYIETSVGFNHNVDELLVGIVTQLRLLQKKKTEDVCHVPPDDQTHSTGKNIIARSLRFTTSKARDLMDRFLQKCDLKTKSCDNLNIL